MSVYSLEKVQEKLLCLVIYYYLGLNVKYLINLWTGWEKVF